MISRLNILGRYIFTIEYEYASQYSRKIQFYDCVKYFEKFQPLAQRVDYLNMHHSVFKRHTFTIEYEYLSQYFWKIQQDRIQIC